MSFTVASRCRDFLDKAIHHVGVHEPERGMLKHAGNASDDLEAAALPEMDGGFVRADHKIELHRCEAAAAGVVEGVHAHGASDAATSGPRSSHVSAIGDMGASSGMIGA